MTYRMCAEHRPTEKAHPGVQHACKQRRGHKGFCYCMWCKKRWMKKSGKLSISGPQLDVLRILRRGFQLTEKKIPVGISPIYFDTVPRTNVRPRTLDSLLKLGLIRRRNIYHRRYHTIETFQLSAAGRKAIAK